MKLLAFAFSLSPSLISLTTAFSFSTSIRCSDGKLLPTPSYELRFAVFTACTEEIIHASVSEVYDAILDFRSYSLWNTFIPKVDVPSDVSSASDVTVGMRMTFTSMGLLPLGLNSSSTEIMTFVEKNKGWNAWRFDDGLGDTVLAAEHPNLLTDLGNGSTRYVSYETMYKAGALVTGVLLKERTQAAFVQQGRDLKRYVENRKR